MTSGGSEQPVPLPINESTAKFAHLNLNSVPSSAAFAPTESRAGEIDDIASVSTETEDDPVNMAMRATLGDGSSMGDEDEINGEDVEDEEEQMVWGGRWVQTPATRAIAHFALRNAPTPPILETRRTGTSATGSDLLNSLGHPGRHVQAASPTHRQSFSDQARPLANRLFGGNFGSIWAPAMGEVNAAGEIPRSRSGSNAGFPRVQRDMAHTPSPWGTPDRTPQQDASNSFGSPTVPDFAGNRRSDRYASNGDNGAPFMPFG